MSPTKFIKKKLYTRVKLKNYLGMYGLNHDINVYFLFYFVTNQFKATEICR